MNRKLLIVAALLAVSGCSAGNSPSDPPPNANIVLYTALGASDTSGFGSSAPCLPLTSCPDGTGYVQTIERRLRTSGKSVTLLNLGIPGAVLAPGVQAIGNQLGRGIVGNFIEREIPFVQRNATLVSVFAGGNDANTIGAAIAAGFGGLNPAAYVQTQTENFGRDLRTLVAGIKDRAPDARIVFLNLPNMAGLPYASGYTLNEKRWLQQIAVGFSAQINSLGSQGALVIDLMCDPVFYQGGVYRATGFTRTTPGIAAGGPRRRAPRIRAASPPRASCSQMTIF